MLTADQLEHLLLPDKHVELVKGVLIVKEPAGYRHGAVAARLAKVLMDYADAQDLGQGRPARFHLQAERDLLALRVS